VVKQFPFFPTPYPDEMFYSVLGRYHMRSGDPSCTRLSRALWGKRAGVNLLLSQSLGQIANLIPSQTGLTAHYFAVHNTIYPFLKPLIPEERGQRVLRLLESDQQEEEQAYLLSGLPTSKSPRRQFFRYCPDCWRDDIYSYGEPYWHRLHQLPGSLVCLIHRKPILNSTVFLSDTRAKFHLASFACASSEAPPAYSDSTAKMLSALAGDAAWLMQHGERLPPSETMVALFDQLLRLKGYRSLSGRRADVSAFHSAALEYYGTETLAALQVNSRAAMFWSQLAVYGKERLQYPMHYLLLMRFLAGSVEEFFTKQHDSAHPYGKGPWPCLNHVCPHYEQDVIEGLEMESSYCSRHPATFRCPHCGFVYRRSRPRPKNKQIAFHLVIVDRGWLWMETFRKLIADGTPIYQMVKILHCYYDTIRKLAVEQGLLPEERRPPNTVYHYSYPKNPASEPAGAAPSDPPDHRKVWLQAMQENPGATRSFLIALHPAAYQWLRANDKVWYETNSPPSQKQKAVDWSVKDEDYLARAQKAVAYLQNLPSRPAWISRRAIERFSGITNIYEDLASGRLPKTQAYLADNLESHNDWCKRKIQWAVAEMIKEGKPLYFPQIQIKATVLPETIERLTDFTHECIMQAMTEKTE
jgi:predicted RNA-binding Zn-ribbon protein involved in translation (DUF1610 family)